MSKESRAHYFAFDTETVNRRGGGHACLVLAENRAGGVDYLEAPETFEQIYNFLAPLKCLVAFNAAFDIRAILHTKFIPAEVLETLAEFDCCIYNGFRFFHIPGKYIKIWKPGCGSLEIFDIKSFFQGMSLRSCAEKFLPAARKLTIPKAWYTEMDKCLKDSRRKKVLEYAAQDVIVLAQIYRVLAGSFAAIGIENPPLYSPGAVAMAVFGRELSRQEPGDRRNKFFKQAYYGGRIEISEMGRVRGPLNYYDLKSAYPAVCCELPDLNTAQFRQGTTGWAYQDDVKAGAYRVRVNVPAEWAFGPFAVRTDTNIIFPVGNFETWIMADGVRICRKYKIPFEVLEFAEYFGGVSGEPFRNEFERLFKMRADKDKNLAVKLILNSFYGKTAEKDNYAQALPPYLADLFARFFQSGRLYGKYTNFPYAGIITERTRLKLWEAAHAQGAVLLATDGIITRGTLKAGNGLGEWGFKGAISEAIILGCGRYQIKYRGQAEKEYHFRGFGRPARIFKRLETCTADRISETILDTKSLKQWAGATELNKGDFNVLIDLDKVIKIEDKKRIWPRQFPQLRNYFKLNIKSKAIQL